MRKEATVKRVISKIVFAGLLIHLLPATLPARAQQPLMMESAMQRVASGVQQKLSKEEIDNRIRIIKKTVKNLKTANVIVSGIIVTIGVIALIAIVLSGGFLFYKLIKKMKRPKVTKPLEEIKPVPEIVITPVEKFTEVIEIKEIPLEKVKPPRPKVPHRKIGKKVVRKKVGYAFQKKRVKTREWQQQAAKLKQMREMLKESPGSFMEKIESEVQVTSVISEDIPTVSAPKAKKFFFGLPAAAITAVVTLFTFFSSPIVAILANIGITGTNLSGAIEMAGELEQLERSGQITLTGDQRRAISQLKNMTRLPITRGLVKSFALKKALHDVVNNAMESNPALGSTIAFGQPKKARAIIAKYIKLKWKEGNSQKAVNELDKAKEPKIYKRVVANLQKFKKQIATLEAKYTNLPKAPELKNAVQEFRAQADRILEGLKKPVLEAEIPKPAVELKPVAVPL